MAKRTSLRHAGRKDPANDPNPQALRTVGVNGEAPESRFKNAAQVWEVANGLEKGNRKRQVKWGRIYKAYNRFPPSEYSKLFKKRQDWCSNVGFGMLSYVVDNNLASFYDMLTERPLACDIVTKKGNTREKKDWSEKISIQWDRALHSWDDFLSNSEQDLLDMLLYGKGVQMKEDPNGWFTVHVPSDDVLVPDSTKINLSNFDVLAIRWEFQLHELYEKIENRESAEAMGWNVDAVIDAMRWSRKDWSARTNDKYLQDIKEGNITISSHLKESIKVYIVFCREYGGSKVSKHIVLRDYTPSLVNEKVRGQDESDSLDAAMKKTGFLFTKTKMFDCYSDVFSVFIDNTGTGMWHNTPSLAEKIYVQCRQYDFTMNAIMDAIKINMSLILQGQTGDAHEKLKEIVFGPYMFIPPEIPVMQQRFQLPTVEATQALQFMMLDMNRGIGQYRIHEKGQGGEAPTATQSQLDAAEAAKLTGTQIRRYNAQHTAHNKLLFKNFIKCSAGETGYEIFKEFKDTLKKQKVPEEAWQWDNIESIKSNMITGSGSPSYKLMAAEKTIALTNVAPMSEGQENAVRDALAALHGRSNVDRYRPIMNNDPTWTTRIIGQENEAMSSPILNPQNVQVFPSDNHVLHCEGHLNDMARTLALVNQNIEKGTIDEDMAKTAMTKLLNTGGHVNAHMEFLARDDGKKEKVKQFALDLHGIQKEADGISQQLQKMLEQKQSGEDQNADPDIQKKIAMNQIDVAHAQKMADIAAAAIAQKHELRTEVDREKAATQIATSTAKARAEIGNARIKK